MACNEVAGFEPLPSDQFILVFPEEYKELTTLVSTFTQPSSTLDLVDVGFQTPHKTRVPGNTRTWSRMFVDFKMDSRAWGWRHLWNWTNKFTEANGPEQWLNYQGRGNIPKEAKPLETITLVALGGPKKCPVAKYHMRLAFPIDFPNQQVWDKSDVNNPAINTFQAVFGFVYGEMEFPEENRDYFDTD